MSRYDENARCAKCGYTDIATRYSAVLDRIERQCCRCGNSWSEMPLDHEQYPTIREALAQDTP